MDKTLLSTSGAQQTGQKLHPSLGKRRKMPYRNIKFQYQLRGQSCLENELKAILKRLDELEKCCETPSPPMHLPPPFAINYIRQIRLPPSTLDPVEFPQPFVPDLYYASAGWVIWCLWDWQRHLYHPNGRTNSLSEDVIIDQAPNRIETVEPVPSLKSYFNIKQGQESWSLC